MRSYIARLLSLILACVANAALATTPLCPGCPLSTAEGAPQPACTMGVDGGCPPEMMQLLQTLAGTTSETHNQKTLATAREQIRAMQMKPQTELNTAYLKALAEWIDRIDSK